MLIASGVDPELVYWLPLSHCVTQMPWWEVLIPKCTFSSNQCACACACALPGWM